MRARLLPAARRAFRSSDFINDTAKFADLVLPAMMQAEQLDIMVTWGHLYISLNQPAIPVPGECVPNVELFRRLKQWVLRTTTGTAPTSRC